MQLGGGPSTLISLSHLLLAAIKQSKNASKKKDLEGGNWAQIHRENTSKAYSDSTGGCGQQAGFAANQNLLRNLKLSVLMISYAKSKSKLGY